MTYGWAILVVLIAIGVLAYLGVFNNMMQPICSCDGCNTYFNSEEGKIFIECCQDSWYNNETHECEHQYLVTEFYDTFVE